MRQTMFNLGDIISTTVILIIFFSVFFMMINMIKKMKSIAPMPPQETLQQKVDHLTTLEHQVKNLSDRQ